MPWKYEADNEIDFCHPKNTFDASKDSSLILKVASFVFFCENEVFVHNKRVKETTKASTWMTRGLDDLNFRLSHKMTLKEIMLFELIKLRDELMAVECIDECYDAEYKCRAACKGDTVCIYECTQDRESETINLVFYKEYTCNFIYLYSWYFLVGSSQVLGARS